MTKVKVSADKNGNVITVSPKNPEYGWFTVEQLVPEFNNGWFKHVKRTAIINGKLDDLKALGLKGSEEMPGKIVVLESLLPFDESNPDRDLKIAGKSGIVCRYFDQPIYRQCFYTTNLNCQDELVSHTNKDEIREVFLAQKEIEAMAPEEEANL